MVLSIVINPDGWLRVRSSRYCSRQAKAPFDHPSLFVFNGQRPIDPNHDGLADDIVFELPEVGAGGYDPNSGFCIPNAANLFAPGMQSRSGGPRVPLDK